MEVVVVKNSRTVLDKTTTTKRYSRRFLSLPRRPPLSPTYLLVITFILRDINYVFLLLLLRPLLLSGVPAILLTYYYTIIIQGGE